MKVCEKCGATYEGRASVCPLDRGRLREAVDPLLGRSLAGTYAIEAKIGQGALASVYRARRTGVEGAVAVKVLSPAMARSSRLRERFLREARAAGSVQHEHVIEVVGSGETEDGVVYLVMELGPSTTLAQAIGGRPLPLGDAREIAAQLACALACAHGLGVVHRDVKPANVLVSRSGEPGRRWSSKLVDFGLASVRGEMGLTTTGELVGTPAYMAPEQVEGRPPTDAVDVYALGCVLFEMLTGRPPFVGATPVVLDAHVGEPPPRPSSAVPGLPARIDGLIAAMLAKDPPDRPGAAEVGRELCDLAC